MTPSTRLATEIALLLRAEHEHGSYAGPVIVQLLAEDERGLPDVLPPRPAWAAFEWPQADYLDFESYWRAQDPTYAGVPFPPTRRSDRWPVASTPPRQLPPPPVEL